MIKSEVSVSKLVERLDLKEYTDGLNLKKRMAVLISAGNYLA